MTGAGASAEKAQSDAHRSPWHGSAREGDGRVGEGEEKGHPSGRHLLGPIGCLDDRHHVRAPQARTRRQLPHEDGDVGPVRRERVDVLPLAQLRQSHFLTATDKISSAQATDQSIMPSFDSIVAYAAVQA